MTREQLLMYLCRCSMSRGPCLRRLCSEGQPHRPSSCQMPTCIPKFFAKVMKKEKIRDIVHNALLLLLIAITSEIRNLTVKRPEKPLTNETCAPVPHCRTYHRQKSTAMLPIAAPLAIALIPERSTRLGHHFRD